MLVKNHSLLFMLIGPPDPHAFPFWRFFSKLLRTSYQRVFTHNGNTVITEILQGGAEPLEGIDWKQTLSVGSYRTSRSLTLLPLLLWGNSFIHPGESRWLQSSWAFHKRDKNVCTQSHHQGVSPDRGLCAKSLFPLLKTLMDSHVHPLLKTHSAQNPHRVDAGFQNSSCRASGTRKAQLHCHR